MDNRRFPLQQTNLRKRKSTGGVEDIGPFTIPWELAEIAYREYSRKQGTGQSLERLKERAGFGIHEFASLLCEFFEHDGKHDSYGRLRRPRGAE